ncbi:hypothetical protein [Ruminiclostridium cellulolyticum]|uniref:Uncharacterized protein n=1 Tax=Ruminiclostridium cellulolyticum (strain ATCC 35319 / DSM 5812 / JCM 6584 / H10) TaxID=394503 RepID=B8I0C0_RUMCH|nr:hypothetical protein [Ruminiclostridium cellulolyticum]ACL77446.1 hypothetical protein Ccel_3155 [Ruminiclostridium cellulolyticum H10]
MNKTISFCVKNQEGLVSLIRILKIQPDGACYIDYGKKNNNYHLSLHPPNEQYSNGQMHIKENGKIILKRIIPDFHDFNKHRCFESVMILESELRKSSAKISNSVVLLELPKNHMVHIVFVRSDKTWGSIKSAFISDKPNKQINENITPYPVFYSIEDMPNANYYLTYNTQPIDTAVLDYVASVKEHYVRSQYMKKSDNHILHVRHPFLSTDIEISITSEDIAKYRENSKNDLISGFFSS